MEIEASIGTIAGFAEDTAEEIRENILTLVSTPMGTCPGDREYGLDYSLLDKPLEVVCGALMMDIADKIEIYEPRAELVDIDFDVDETRGALLASLHICPADNEAEEDSYTYDNESDTEEVENTEGAE